MSDLKINAGSSWYDPCSTPIRVFFQGSWIAVGHGTKFYSEGRWKEIVCHIYYSPKWIADPTSYYCEKSFMMYETGVIQFDFYDYDDYALVGYVDTPGVHVNVVPVSTEQLYLPNDGRAARDCYALSSGKLIHVTNKRRIQVNMSKLMSEYATQRYFAFKIRGNKGYEGYVSGSYSLRGANQGEMGMSSLDGVPQPYVTASTGIGMESFRFPISGGGNGVPSMASPVLFTAVYDRVASELVLHGGNFDVPAEYVKAAQINTGNQFVSRLLKVSNNAAEIPLDVNNEHTALSGLPQAVKANIDTDADYIPKTYNTGACPI